MGLAHLPVVTGSMLSVLAMHGADGETLELLKGIPPASLNSYMVTAALTAFSHSGNVDAAHALLEQVEIYGSPTPSASIQSYTALVGGYARSGDFASALAIIDRAKTRVGEDGVMWMTVLGPCRRFDSSITTYHRSLHDFFLDKERAGIYHIHPARVALVRLPETMRRFAIRFY